LKTIALLVASTEAASLNRHNVKGVTFVQTLPDTRADTVTEKDIAAHETARAEAAKVKKNPQAALLQSIKADLESINFDLSFGVSFSQNSRNNRAKALCAKISNAIKDYANKLI
jgi:hypothetical protein